MLFASGSVVIGVTFADLAAGGGGDCALAAEGASAAAVAIATPIAVARTLLTRAKGTPSMTDRRHIDSPLFFYDLGSPYAWLTAERIFDAVWIPVLLGGIFKATGRGSWAETDKRANGIAEVERRARERGLPSLRWPDPWPNNGLHAMRVAAAADSREFALAAFRLHFTEGRPLSDPENVAAAAERVGIEPVEDKQKLRANTDRALELGVFGVPTVVVDGEPFWGDDRLDEALARQQQLQ
jgi:2-hydroxychromene-2-carboxylate isomerase